jgi:hypothetical protein
MRKKALFDAGLLPKDEIEVVCPNRKLTEEEFKRINIQDNLPFGEFDYDLLSGSFDVVELVEWGMPEKWLGCLNFNFGNTVEESKEKLKKEFPLEAVELSKLKPHPRNYRIYPEDHVTHIVESIKQHGLYRNIVIAQDDTILSGHGMVLAAEKIGMETIPAIRLSISPDQPRALKILTGDNEINHLGEIDDRKLIELFKEIKESDQSGLSGTGYDDAMLANRIYVTNPPDELRGFDANSEWTGMPEYDGAGINRLKLIISFRNKQDRAKLGELLNLKLTEQTRFIWWPEKEKEDAASVQFK